MIKFVGSFETVLGLPKSEIPEYAFIGRSNVGKSSLINAIAGSAIARTSKTPGRTQSLNLFQFTPPTVLRTEPPLKGGGNQIMIMDLPGYGYACVSKTDQIKWAARLADYLESRKQLRRLFILIDSRVGVKSLDLEVMEFCDAHQISYQIVYTKKDKKVREKEQGEIRVDVHPSMFPEIVETSAEKKIGIERLREIIGI